MYWAHMNIYIYVAKQNEPIWALFRSRIGRFQTPKIHYYLYQPAQGSVDFRTPKFIIIHFNPLKRTKSKNEREQWFTSRKDQFEKTHILIIEFISCFAELGLLYRLLRFSRNFVFSRKITVFLGFFRGFFEVFSRFFRSQRVKKNILGRKRFSS